MLSLTLIIVFVFCLAIAVAGTWISYQFISTYNTKFHKTYFYYLITTFGFGFYGIWGQILMRSFLSAMKTDSETVQMVANFLPVLGIPFLMISWIMLPKMGYYLAQVVAKRKELLIHAPILFTVVALVGTMLVVLGKDHPLFGEHLFYFEISILLIIEFVYILWFASLVLYGSKRRNKKNKTVLTQFVQLMILGLLLRVCVLIFHEVNMWVLALLLLLYFLTNFIPIFYLRLKSDLIFTPVHAEQPNEEKKELLFKTYRITKREKEIINKICEGNTNQQIADDLFISLQTVKDHTHRIYSKIGINSRLKLVQMINELP
ncbi:MAG: helix-turn-helix transcriptional regulator [Maribacter sp.]|uniref:helix-turn-helix transcriptional regulator n=1 Tax=Maribacter sp. TaxID=1897614 RepID=UPI0032992224